MPPLLVEAPVCESVIVCPGAVGLAHKTMMYSVFTCFGCAVQLPHLTTVIIRVHILLRPSTNDSNTARGREGEATLFEVERIAEVG